MTKETVLSTFKEILRKSGMENVISLSQNVNELADFMIYQEQDAPEYLAMNGAPLFPIREIRNILYQYGGEKLYHYVGSELQFVIELKGDARYIIEFGDNGFCDDMYFLGEWLSEDKKIKVALARYNQLANKRFNMQCLVDSVVEIVECHEEVSDSELREVREEACCYLEENPMDQDFLLHYAYISLEKLAYEERDLFDTKSIVRRIVRNGCPDQFLDHIRSIYGKPNGYMYSAGPYLFLVTVALQMIREIKEEESAE